jgi:hypothetical protein
LPAIQRRRAFPAIATQTMQRAVHNGLRWVFRQHGAMKPPPLIKVIAKIPGAQSFIARVVGVGIRPEHVHTPELRAKLTAGRN